MATDLEHNELHNRPKGLRVQFSLRGLLITAALVAIVSRIYAVFTERGEVEALLTLAFLAAPLLGLYFTSVFYWTSETRQLKWILSVIGVIGVGVHSTVVGMLAINDAWREVLSFSLFYIMILVLFWMPQILILFERMDRPRKPRPELTPDFSNIKID